jgi:hypothetical protein
VSFAGVVAGAVLRAARARGILRAMGDTSREPTGQPGRFPAPKGTAAAPLPATALARAHRYLALGILAASLLQFVLAGYAAFGGSTYDAHRAVGTLIVVAALVLVVLAYAGRRSAAPVSIALFGLTVLQYVLGSAGTDAPALGALHPVNALAVLAMAGGAAAGRGPGMRHHGGARA